MAERNIFAELKRRNVYKVAVAYGVVAWLVVQVVSTVLPVFHAPEWVAQTVVVIVILGFPIAPVIAWAFEMTPEGMKRTKDVPAPEKLPHWSKRKFIAVFATLALIAAALLGWQLLGRPAMRDWERRSAESEVKAGRPARATAVPEKSIAVLPFENLSSDKENAYFADGIQDEILAKLANIADLKVISRTSTTKYKSRPESLRQVGLELGVVNLLEGSVQRSGNKVRVIAQLIDSRNDADLWAQTYDRDLADVFTIQSEIARAIADQLQAKLSPNEKKAIEQPPTTDLAAFDLYSRAKSLLLTVTFSVTAEPDLRKAIELLDEAVKRDPSFFDAYCQLAWAHELVYAVLGFDHTAARLALAEAAVQAATRLRPDAAETHLARAQYLYNGLRDYAGALAELEIARQALPNDPRLFALTGYILRRRGQQEEGLQNVQRAVELDPRNFDTLQQIAVSYQLLGRYAEAIAALDRASAIVPDNVETRANRAEFYLFWKADTRPLHQTIDAILGQGSEPLSVRRPAGSLALWPSAIRLRPNEHSSRWATMIAGPRARLI